jgi:hypothetical protein
MHNLSQEQEGLPFAPTVVWMGIRWTCKRVLTTSRGHTNVAAIAPALPQPCQVSTPITIGLLWNPEILCVS